ncbi:MAG: hypothetical protein ABIK93_10165 [candidate division WOR-3 bacterium]
MLKGRLIKAVFVGLMIFSTGLSQPSQCKMPAEGESFNPFDPQHIKDLKKALPGYIEAIKTERDLDMMCEYMQSLIWLKDTSAVMPLIEFLYDTNRVYREYRTRGINERGMVIRDSVQVGAEPPDSARRADTPRVMATIALGAIGDKRAVPVLKWCLERKQEERVRLQAALALCDIGEVSIGLPVVEEYARRKGPPPWNIYRTVDWFYPAKLHSVRHKNNKNREMIIEYFERAVNFTNEHIRVKAALWLLELNKKKYRNIALQTGLEIARNGKDSAARSTAMIIFGDIGGKTGQDLLKEFISDKDRLVANQARRVLNRLEGRKDE